MPARVLRPLGKRQRLDPLHRVEIGECPRGQQNDTIIKRFVSLKDYLIGVNAGSEAEKEAIIALFQKHGITRLGGQPSSQAVRVVH